MPNTTQKSNEGVTIQSVERSFNIINALQKRERAGVTELADAVGMTRSSMYVYLKTLVQLGYVVKTQKEYTLSYRFLEKGGLKRNRSKLYRAAKFEVDKLAYETGEVGNLGIEENGLRVLLYKTGGQEAIHDNAPIGEYTKMHWTALGKALLAHVPRSRVMEVVDKHGLPRSTEQTITDVGDLLDELADIREQGFSVEDEDRRNGVLTVAVPIMDNESDEVVSAVSLSGPKERLLNEHGIDPIVNTVESTANSIELRYNYYL